MLVKGGPGGNGFRAVDPVNTEVVRCQDGEFLSFHNSSLFQWNPDVPGDALSDCALLMSQLLDRTVLYIMRHKYLYPQVQRISGFYNHITKSTYFVKNGLANPMGVDILCRSGIWCNDFNDVLPLCKSWYCWLCILHHAHPLWYIQAPVTFSLI